MDQKEYRCEINGRTYILRSLVLGQIGQITSFLQGVEINEAMGMAEIVNLLGERLPEAIAIVLTEEGKKLKDKDLQALTDELREHLDIGTAMELVDRFFALNPIALVLEKLTGMMLGISGMISTGSIKSSSSSPAGTSPDETGSSGDTLLESACPMSTSDQGGGSSGKR